MLYDEFKPVVDIVLNNWTALQLAVEHGMGAPGGEKTAQLMSVYLARYCVENIVDVADLTEVIEDLMDEEFDTTCHDNSPREVANLLLTFLEMLKTGRHDELNATIAALPKCQIWLSQRVYDSVPPQYHGNPDDDTTSSSGEYEESVSMTDGPETNGEPHPTTSENCNGPITNAESSQQEPMDEDVDPGWTVVKTRRKK